MWAGVLSEGGAEDGAQLIPRRALFPWGFDFAVGISLAFGGCCGERVVRDGGQAGC